MEEDICYTCRVCGTDETASCSEEVEDLDHLCRACEKITTQAMTQTEIYMQLRALIPEALWFEYNYMTYANMAEIPELAQWHDELLQAEADWWAAA